MTRTVAPYRAGVTDAVRIRSWNPGPLVSPEEAMNYSYTPAEHTASDEVMPTTDVYGHAERLRSYERLAQVFEVARPDK